MSPRGPRTSGSPRGRCGPPGCAAGLSGTTGSPWSSPPASPAELAATPLASREGGSGTRDTLTAALVAALGQGAAQAPAALSLSTTAALRAAVLAAAAPAVISELAIADDLASGRLVRVETPPPPPPPPPPGAGPSPGGAPTAGLAARGGRGR